MNDTHEHPKDAIAICLSGGGFRAMLFHLGALRRMNEFGIVHKAELISSVSGGSIMSGALAICWDFLEFDKDGVAQNFEIVERKVEAVAQKLIDIPSTLAGLIPGISAGHVVANFYRRYLFGDRSLVDLPAKFTFNTTNFTTGDNLRWSSTRMADYRVGQVERPHIPVADVVAASSAFPPFISPMNVDVPGTIVDFAADPKPVTDAPTQLMLTDGGVYDSLGLQPADEYNTVLVSDAGAPANYRALTKSNWVSQVRRANSIADNQVRALRRRHLVQDYIDEHRSGTLWAISTNILNYELDDSLPVSPEVAAAMAKVPTRLAPFRRQTQRRLTNFGYALADAGIRKHTAHQAAPPPRLPYPDAPLAGS